MGGTSDELSRNYEKYEIEFNALPFERILEKYRRRKLIEIIREHIQPHSVSVLEIGPGYNSVLEDIHSSGKRVIIEPSTQLYDYNKSKYFEARNFSIHNVDISGFSAIKLDEEFDLVILSSVLHEFIDAVSELSSIHKLMKKGAKLLLVVPNNESIHRQFGVTMGVLKSTSTLTRTEILMQQNKNYSCTSLTNFINSNGFITEFVTTSFVKPHTHSQMQEWFDTGVIGEEDLESLYGLSNLFHPFNSEIFLIAIKR